MDFPYLKYNKLLEQVFLNDRMFGKVSSKLNEKIQEWQM